MRCDHALITAVLVATLTLLLPGRGEAVINVGNTIQTGMLTLQAGQTLRVYVHHRAGQGARCAVRIVYRDQIGEPVAGFAQLQLQGGDAGQFEFSAVTTQQLRAELTLVPIAQANGNCIVSAEVLDVGDQFLYRLGDAAAFDIVAP